MEKMPFMTLDQYLYGLTADLDHHAQYLHSRDVHHMVRCMHAQREFQYLKPSSSSSIDRKRESVPPGSSISDLPVRRGRPRGSTNSQPSSNPSDTLRYLQQSASQRANSQLQGQQILSPQAAYSSNMRPLVKNYGSSAQACVSFRIRSNDWLPHNL